MFTQANHPLAVDTPLGKDALLLTRFEGEERLSTLFRYRLHLLSPNRRTVEFEKLLGRSVTAKVQTDGLGPRYFNGICVELIEADRDADFVHYDAVLAPKLFLLTERTNCRIFQRLSTLEILGQVLDGVDHKISVEDESVYFKRDFCVQYNETDFAFLSRLMEEEGLYFDFEQADGSHKMVVTDDARLCPDIPDPKTLEYDDARGGLRDGPRVSAWRKRQRIAATTVSTRDAHAQLFGKKLEASHEAAPTVTAGTVDHKTHVTGDPVEQYAYPSGAARAFDGVHSDGSDASSEWSSDLYKMQERWAKREGERHVAESLRIEGETNDYRFTPGAKFSLKRHFDGDGRYLITSTTHKMEWNGGYGSLLETDAPSLESYAYTCAFECLPDGVSYRPPKTTPKPRIAGVQTATVVGLASADGDARNNELFIDRFGRVKVKFHWDRSDASGADASCWLRVAQVWAGKGWGAFFWPRADHEVVIAFREGDPDRPMILGSVYNNVNATPYKLPDDKMIAGVKSLVFGGEPADDFSSVIWHDMPGVETVHVHSNLHQVHRAEQDQLTRTPCLSMEFIGG